MRDNDLAERVTRFVVPALAGSSYPPYKLPPEGGTTNIDFK